MRAIKWLRQGRLEIQHIAGVGISRIVQASRLMKMKK
jgi:hypothetical protein